MIRWSWSSPPFDAEPEDFVAVSIALILAAPWACVVFWSLSK
jgi:hypothetical protein